MFYWINVIHVSPRERSVLIKRVCNFLSDFVVLVFVYISICRPTSDSYITLIFAASFIMTFGIGRQIMKLLLLFHSSNSFYNRQYRLVSSLIFSFRSVICNQDFWVQLHLCYFWLGLLFCVFFLCEVSSMYRWLSEQFNICETMGRFGVMI